MRIIFIRHGEPDYERDCLTPLGHLQARAAAERLQSEGVEALYSSPMGRARETARYAADQLGLPVTILDFMRELRWDGHPWDTADALPALGWDLTDPLWPAHPLYADNRVVQSVERVETGTDEWLRSLGYVREGIYYRCQRPDSGQHTVALFCHGGSSSAAMGRILHLPFPYVCAALHQPFTSLTILRLSREAGSLRLPVIELTGDDRHIRGLERL